ncbi:MULTISPECIES: hypothetical protein [unclassified Curtobacterium]|uniref:hypothetical protein n=1 Tax=unclassified Curtobacterium TaxID=257496 RepID=UPI003A805781
MTIDPRNGSGTGASLTEFIPAVEWLWLVVGLVWLVVAIAGDHLTDRLRGAGAPGSGRRPGSARSH